MKKYSILLTVLVLTLTLFTACGCTPMGETEPTTPSKPTTPPTIAPTAAPTAAPTEPTAEVTIPMPSGSEGMDDAMGGNGATGENGGNGTDAEGGANGGAADGANGSTNDGNTTRSRRTR